MATAKEHKKRLLQEVKQLSPDRIKALADFAAYLKEREEWEETAQIIGDEETFKRIKLSRETWSKGKKNEFVSLEDLKAKLNV